MSNLIMAFITLKSDSLGAAASFLCMVHCLATPFLFVAQACAKTCCSEAPMWWRAIDFVFLFISGMAIYSVSKTSSLKWVWIGLSLTWVLLAWSVTAESLAPALFSSWLKYSAASVLIGLHLYNMRRGQCGRPECPIHHG